MTEHRMNSSCKVRLSVIFKLGHTLRNQRRVVTTVTDRRWGTIAWLMSRTWPDPAGVFFKIRPFGPPNPSIHPIHSLFLPLPSLFNFHILPLDHCSPKILQSPKSVNLLVGVAGVGVCLATEYLSSCFLHFYGVCLEFLLIYLAFLFIS